MKNILDKIRKDDLLHIVCSIIIISSLKIFFPLWLSAIITFGVGILKELIWDKLLKKGTPDWRDIISDTIGIFIGIF